MYKEYSNVYVNSHPLVQHKISMLRNKNTGTNEFRKLIEEIAMLMGYEALSDLPLEDVEIETPICKMVGKELSDRDTYRNMYDTYDCRKEVSNCSCFKSWPGNGKRYYRTYS